MKNYKTIIFSILFCILIANIFIFEYIFNKKYFDYRFNEKILSIEKSINYELAIIGHIFKGIAETIKEDRVFLNSETMQDFVKNFDPQYNFNFKSNGLIEGILILDKNGKELVNTILPGINNRLKNDPNSENIRCLQEAGDTDFNLVVNSIRIGNYNKDFIVPVNMKIADHTGKYIGVICSGIVVKKLLEDINSRFGYSSIEGVTISNAESQDAVNVNSLGIIRTLRAFLTDDTTILSYKMQEIPIFIELRIKYWYFKLALARFCLFIFLLSFFAIIIIYLSLRKTKNEYLKALLPLKNKLYTLNVLTNTKNLNINDVTTQLIDFPASQKELLSLTNKLSDLIDSSYNIFLEKDSLKENEIKMKFIRLLIIEHHYSRHDKVNENIAINNLYSDMLITMIHEEYKTMSLGNYINQVTDYCIEYFDINIVIENMLEAIKEKPFTLKYSALTESIFSIFSFIQRANVAKEGTNFIISTSYQDNDRFPTIAIKFLPNLEVARTTLGWEVGANLPYLGLLTTYLIARENELYLKIDLGIEYLSFILIPINTTISDIK